MGGDWGSERERERQRQRAWHVSTKREKKKKKEKNSPRPQNSNETRPQERIACVAFARTCGATLTRASDQLASLKQAAEALVDCGAFGDVLAAVLAVGNEMNAGTARGQACGFKLESLLKLADVKGVDRKTSLLHFVLKQMLKAEGGSDSDDSEDEEEEGEKTSTPTATATPKRANLPPPPSPAELKLRRQRRRRDRSAVASLTLGLACVRPAANVQLGAVRALIAEARAGLSRVDRELLVAAGVADADEGKKGGNNKGRPSPPADAPAEKDELHAAVIRLANRSFSDAMASFHASARAQLSAADEAAAETLEALRKAAAFFGEDFDEGDPAKVLRVVRDFLSLVDKAEAEIARAEALAAADAERERKAAARKEAVAGARAARLQSGSLGSPLPRTPVAGAAGGEGESGGKFAAAVSAGSRLKPEEVGGGGEKEGKEEEKEGEEKSEVEVAGAAAAEEKPAAFEAPSAAASVAAPPAEPEKQEREEKEAEAKARDPPAAPAAPAPAAKEEEAQDPPPPPPSLLGKASEVSQAISLTASPPRASAGGGRVFKAPPPPPPMPPKP